MANTGTSSGIKHKPVHFQHIADVGEKHCFTECYSLFNCFFFSVINFPLPEGKSGQQTVDMLQKRIETLGATKTGNFVVDCETYQSQQRMCTKYARYFLHLIFKSSECNEFSILLVFMRLFEITIVNNIWKVLSKNAEMF